MPADHHSTVFNSEQRQGIKSYNGRVCLVVPARTAHNTTYVVVPAEDKNSLGLLRECFPQGKVVDEAGVAAARANLARVLAGARLEEVTLVVYVPENRVGQVQLGQEAEVQVDSFPERVFVGHVANIAGEAEFTPRNVQTQEERVNLVFAVKVRIPNPDCALKPGMPADATIQP
jgi:hypothetical protein